MTTTPIDEAEADLFERVHRAFLEDVGYAIAIATEAQRVLARQEQSRLRREAREAQPAA